ncbi:gonadotropin-releasing hormone receptor-like [Cimex lectularius]|uniref:G-protein coupled receptors family 1 profile domain-containing protein n=1 Tax=Cimex lectularius TaxID=79782 RepID=A0A8I6SP09_CIMLE|nr:gonadotropin-releasing hormone receptor-like [Cimex lectularius]XP_024085169.1 gonadotropin-releasing hormone receptor-like [Cimex lectularius]XP_024085170.1 gonadotropin-releasing hormone receptor-like [Cimex lectularius]XP_024085171.1 gonadotropin-releasing hormone receptor-like [Cimex lectularius]XP_024085172.1 gonadotropin-releasing hormone receptor-like [Cimex lectularius]
MANRVIRENDLVLTLFPDFTEYVTNDNVSYAIPIDMRFNEGHLVTIAFYSILMVFSAIGNISVLTMLLKRKQIHRSRINNMLVHLVIADLLVTFINMPIEIVWAATVSWWGGDFLCRIAAFFRTFGLYQSSFSLVSIGIDRYYAVLKPLQLSAADKRGKMIISSAWLASALCSIPQMVVFSVKRHPNITWYEQCITMDSYSNVNHDVTYSVFGTVMMYIFPFLILTYCYGSILAEICRRTREPNAEKFRRSNIGFLGKAKTRTLKMTITIILTFFICWTPYYIMAFWYWIDKESAKKINLKIQKGLFLFACTNSSINPIVYGVFNIRKQRQTQNKTRENHTFTTEIRLNQLSSNKLSLQHKNSSNNL